MFVEKLDLFGFKSFAHRTEVPLARGITAIVGPNGCGKSNISDAFRWVLGEQNARTLRGERIQDVIFKGSGAAKPLGMAEVGLTVTNDDGSLPLEYTSIAVARRIYRSGESEFLINKLPCRLKDIRDLFSGTGMGSHGYSVIERDMVDQVLSDKDDARRFLFEEASGISRYKQRRKESERRLEGVEQDLTRIEDMTREIERGVRSLARQAGKVRRWRRLKDELDRHEIRLAWERWRELRAESLSTDEVHRRREEEREDLSVRLAVLDTRRETARTNLLDLAGRLTQASRAAETAERTLFSAREEIRVRAAKLEAWAGEEAELRARIARYAERREVLGADRSALAPVLAALAKDLEAAEEAAREAGRRRGEAEILLREVRGRLQAAQQISLDLSTSGTGSRRDLEGKRERLAAASRKQSALLEHLEAFSDRSDQVGGDLSKTEGRLSEIGADLEALGGERAACEAERQEARRNRGDLVRNLGEAERRKTGLKSRLELLEEQHERHAGFAAAVRHLLENRDSYPGLVGVVGEEVRLRPGAEVQGRAVLGERVPWILVDDEDAAISIMGRLRELSLGGVTFFPLAEAGCDPEGEGVDPAVLDLFAPAPAAARFAGYLARETRLAGSLPEAREKARETGRRIVTPEGDAVERTRVFRLAGEETEEAEILRREQEIPRLRAELSEAEALVEGLEHEEARLSSRESALQEQWSALESRGAGLDRERIALSETRTAGRTEQAMLLEENTRLLRERDALGEEIGLLSEEIARLEGTVSRTETDSVQAQATFEELRRAAEEQERSKDERVREANEREMETLRRRNALESEQNRGAALEREAEELGRAVQEAETRLAERGAEAAEAGDRIERLEEGMGGLEEAVHQTGEERQAAEGNHQACQDSLFQLDSELRSERERLDSVVQTLHAEDVERLQKRNQADTVLERIRTDYNVDLETWAPPVETEAPRRRRRARPRPAAGADESGVVTGVDAGAAGEGGTASALMGAGEGAAGAAGEHDGEGGTGDTGLDQGESLDADLELLEEEAAGLDEGAGVDEETGEPAGVEDAATASPSGPMDPAARATRMTDLRRVLDGMGSLNFLAEEEYRAGKERLDFHRKQAADLRAAREDLLEAIRRINETAGQMFEETFRAVQDNFRNTFEQLFPGGEATLALMGGDPLEGDIEISARPRGKRLESIRLLSSGERALTAIALLFAIYLAKPSPVCLLDEVDAPLDDANLDRFNELVRRFSERTQFIVITHNKKTMEMADHLFGVTMEEQGISKLVSVRLDGSRADLDSAFLAGTSAPDSADGEPAGAA